MINALIDRLCWRDPDFIIGSARDPYLLRWYLIPRNRLFNIYIHLFLRSDDDRALHDHPWVNMSVLLAGTYIEHTIEQGGVHVHTHRRKGDWTIRSSGRRAHRIELIHGPCWTLFITGPRYRHWGFHCVDGWIPWEEFTAAGSKGEIGKGCGD